MAQTNWHGSPQAPAVAKPPAATVSVGGDHAQLARAILAKFATPEFAATRPQGRIPLNSHSVPGELAVRQARDRIALARRAPADAKVLTIPRAGAAPLLDGTVGEAEWRGALRLVLEPAERKAVVLLFVHGGTLYLGALVPSDKTTGGYDQFRFWYHLGLSPFLEDERAMIGSAGSRVLRGLRLPRAGEPIRDGVDPRSLAQDSDWGVSERLRAASVVAGFRQFETAIDLAEAGLGHGVTFPAFIDIEGDPIMDAAGKFKARLIEGQIGSRSEPIWMRVAP